MLSSITQMRIALKLPLIIVAAALTLAMGIGVPSYLQSAAHTEEEITSKFSAILEGSKTTVNQYMHAIEEDLHVTAASPFIHDAVRDFGNAWYAFGANQTPRLQTLYIEDNPNATGEKHLLNAANDGSAYSTYHAKYHPWIRQLLIDKGFYDIFLFDLNGNLIYSVYKNADFATNIVHGKWADTDLNKAFVTARADNEPNHFHFFDFKPYAPSHGTAASFISTGIFDDNGVKLGVLAFEVPSSKLEKFMSLSTGLGETGETILVGEDHLMRNNSHLAQEPTFLKVEVKSDAIDQAMATGEIAHTFDIGHTGEEVSTYAIPIEFHGVKWAIVAQESTREIMEPVYGLRNIMAMIALGMLALVGAVGYFFSRQITGSITDLADTMAKLAQGDSNVDLVRFQRPDEIGDMTKAVEIFKQNAVERERLEEAQKTDQKDKEQRTATIATLISGFDASMKQMLDQVAAAATEMESTANSMSSIADSTNAKASAVAAASEEATTSVQTVAGAAEELSSSISEIRRQAAQSTEIGEQATTTAEDANKKVEGLSDSARQIGEVLNLIQDIAEQTNLLALNATIEAARAGEAGKGFAVVASEVKELANQTAKATEQISQQISGIQDSTNDAVGAIRTITETIKKVNEIGGAIAASVEEQNAATMEISSNVQEAANGSAEVASNIISVTEAATESASASTQVSAAATQLARQADQLRQEVDQFLKGVRAA